MFRWLALCLVLCLGAFLLVAMAVRAFAPAPPPIDYEGDPAVGDAVSPKVPRGVVQIAPAGGAATWGLPVVVPDARLTAIERNEVPSESEGKLEVIGTEIKPGEAVPASEHVRCMVGFLVVEVGAADSPAAQQLSPAERIVFDDKTKVYRRWRDGEPLPPGKLVVAKEEREFRKLHVGEHVQQGQLLALVNPTKALDELAIKNAQLENREAEASAAGYIKTEAERREGTARDLRAKGFGLISEDDYNAALLGHSRAIEEERAKKSARKQADQELRAALNLLKMHEIRATIPGEIKVIYKNRGDAVKNLDAVVQIQNPNRLRVEAVMEIQDAHNLVERMPVLIEPTRPVPPKATLKGHQQEVDCVAVSRPTKDGKTLILSGSEDGTLRAWDAAAEQPLWLLEHDGAAVHAVTCSGPGAARNLALTGDHAGVGRIIDLNDPDAVPTKLKDGHKGPINCVAFSPDGTVCATGGEDYTIRLWKTDDGERLAVVAAAHRAAVTSLQFASNEQLASAGRDGLLIVWDVKNPKTPVNTKKEFNRRSGDVPQLGLSPDGKVVLFDQGAELRLQSLDDPRRIEGVIRNPSGSLSFTTMALFAPDGKTILTNNAGEGRLQLWRAPSKRADDPDGVLSRASELRQFVWSNAAATCGAFAPDSSFAVTGTHDNLVQIWGMPAKDPKTHELVEQPRKGVLSLVEHSLDTSARQVRVWADLVDDPDNPNLNQDLTPGGTATLVIPTARKK